MAEPSTMQELVMVNLTEQSELHLMSVRGDNEKSVISIVSTTPVAIVLSLLLFLFQSLVNCGRKE